MTQILIESGSTLLKPQGSHQSEHSTSFDVLYMLRILFYILVVVKLIELSFLRRKKQNIKERVYRKFLFAHQEILKQFTEQDKINMEHTLNNTIKNANIAQKTNNIKIKKSKKRVSFIVDKNTYYEPKSWKDNEEEDDDFFLDINEKDNLIKLEENESFKEKKVQDQFQERFNLEEEKEKLEETSTNLSSKNTTEQSSLLNQNESEQISELPVDSKLSRKIQQIEQDSKIVKNTNEADKKESHSKNQ